MHQYAMCILNLEPATEANNFCRIEQLRSQLQKNERRFPKPTLLEALKTSVPSEASGRQRHLVRNGSRNVGKWRKQCRDHILAIVLFVIF